MKIFHIVSNPVWGGGEQYVFDLTSQQLQEDHSVELFCRKGSVPTKRFQQLGVPVHALPLRGIADMNSARMMARILANQPPCIVHAHNFKDCFTVAFARLLCRNRNIRIVATRHLVRTGKRGPLYRWLYSQIDAFYFVSQLARDRFFSSNPPADKHKARVITGCVNISGIPAPINLRQQLGIKPDVVVGMYHGRLHPEKGLDVLLDAVHLLRELPMAIVLLGNGSDEYTTLLKERIQKLDLTDRIILAGFQNPVLPFVAAADFGVLPSIVEESCLLAVQEYMACSIPVIVTDNGGQREYVNHHHSGLLIPPNDSDSLAKAINTLVSDDTLRHTMGENARKDFVEKLSYIRMYNSILDLYRSVL